MISSVDCGGDSFAVVDGKGIEDLLPAVDFAAEVLSARSPVIGDEVEHLQRGLLVWEMPSMAHRSTEAGIETFDGVGIRYDMTSASAVLPARVLEFGCRVRGVGGIS